MGERNIDYMTKQLKTDSGRGPDLGLFRQTTVLYRFHSRIIRCCPCLLSWVDFRRLLINTFPYHPPMATTLPVTGGDDMESEWYGKIYRLTEVNWRIYIIHTKNIFSLSIQVYTKTITLWVGRCRSLPWAAMSDIIPAQFSHSTGLNHLDGTRMLSADINSELYLFRQTTSIVEKKNYK